ncbi:MAG: glycosyltransferase family 2 protein [Acidobacteriaceae bacterium]|jgi:hypothetical protein
MLFYRRKPRIDRPKIVMTLLVRDEADVIDLFIRYHIRAGIDALVVTDNGSSDGTRDILEHHLRAGAVTEIIDEPTHVFDQPRFVDRMILRARDYYGADYCINSDADEFWYTASGSLRHEISLNQTNRIYCPSFYMLPAQGQDFWQATDRCVKRADPRKFGVTKYYNLFDKPMHKAIHRTQGYRMIDPGNHGLEMEDDFPLPGNVLNRLRSSLRYKYSVRSKAIWIYHYSIRSVQQFKKKILQNGAALEANNNSVERDASHWRYLYRGCQANTLDLEAEFYKVTGAANIELLRKAGIVVSDATMKDTLAAFH